MNPQYDSIMRLYARRQADGRRKLEERLHKIQTEIPGLKELEAGLTELYAGKARAAVQGASREKAKLEEQISALTARRLSLLEEKGYSLSDLEPSYVCPDCRDTGYREGDKCHCFLQAEIRLLYQQSRLEEILKEENFSTFSYEWYEGADRKVMQDNVREARLFTETFDREFRNLLLLGEVGTGKTFLSHCIAKELIDTCHSVVYLTAFELFQLLARAAFGKDSPRDTWEPGYSYLFDCDLLIIDDLGTELPNSFTVSQFFLCINERILRRKSTLISSNLNMEALDSIYSERTLSRIISSYTIRQLPGNDIRIKKRRKLL